MNIQPSVQPVQFGMKRTRVAAVALAALAGLTACSSGGGPSNDPSPSLGSLQEDTYTNPGLSDKTSKRPGRVLTDCGPNDGAGKTLACEAEAVARKMNTMGFSPRGVNEAIDAVYGIHVTGNADQVAEQYSALKNSDGQSYFEEVKYTAADFNQPGLVVVVPPGHGASQFGDVFVTLGEGKIANDAVRPLSESVAAQQDLRVFKPVLPPVK